MSKREDNKLLHNMNRSFAIVIIAILVVLGSLFMTVYSLKLFSDTKNFSSHWSLYAEAPTKKSILQSHLQRDMGYGHFIHNFKNYVLRATDGYKQAVLVNGESLLQTLDLYRQEPLNDREVQALDTIEATIREYLSKVPIVTDLHKRQASIDDIDRAVKVDDGPMLQALDQLQEEWQAVHKRGRPLIEHEVATLHTMAQGFAIIMAISLIGFGFYYRKKIADGHLQELLHVKLVSSESRFQSVFDSCGDAIITINAEGLIETFNPAAEKVFGHTRAEVVGQDVSILLPASERDDHRHYVANSTRYSPRILNMHRELRAQRKDGTAFPIELVISPFHEGKNKKFIGILRDTSVQEAYHDRLAHLATHDPLTGLPNRALVMDRLGQAMEIATRNQAKTCVLFLDLDNFKDVNDTMGHDAGDLLLKLVATRLRDTVRGEDTVARLGGDEFIIVANNMRGVMEAIEMGNKILDHLGEPMSLYGETLTIQASIGISLFPDHYTDPEDLIKVSDQAMYHAKSLGKNRVQVYVETGQARA